MVFSFIIEKQVKCDCFIQEKSWQEQHPIELADKSSSYKKHLQADILYSMHLRCFTRVMDILFETFLFEEITQLPVNKMKSVIK